MADIETYRRLLMVNKHRLDDELEIQPEIMMRIAAEVTVRNSRALEAKDDLDRVEARLFNDLREEHGKAIEVTKGLVLIHRERKEAWQGYQAARAEYESWSGLLTAWRERGYVMKTLSDLYVAQYFSTDSVSSTRGRRDAEQDTQRAAMRRATHQTLASFASDEQPKPRRRVVE